MFTKPVQLLIAGLAVFLLAEDVEHPPIIIEPPPRQPEIKPPPPPAPRQPKISIPGPLRIMLDPALPPIPPEPEPARELTEHQRVKQRIDGYFCDLMARRRVQSGNVDPGWYYLAGRMDHYWAPDFSLVHDKRITRVSGAWLKKEIWDWLSGWYRSVQRNDPYGTGDDPRKRVDTTLLDMQRDAYFDDGYGSKVTTLVEVRITKDGALTTRLFESSGHPQFDRAAVEAVRTAIKSPDEDDLPPGPARSIYALNARYAILPPLPVVGFAFDISLGYFDLMYPLKKLVFGNSTLVAVYREK